MSIEAMRKALNYIENTAGELGIKLSCGDAIREALAAQPPAAPVEREPIVCDKCNEVMAAAALPIFNAADFNVSPQRSAATSEAGDPIRWIKDTYLMWLKGDLDPAHMRLGQHFFRAQPQPPREMWAMLYLHDWDPPKEGQEHRWEPGKNVFPQIHNVYETWQEAETLRKRMSTPEKYWVCRVRMPAHDALALSRPQSGIGK